MPPVENQPVSDNVLNSTEKIDVTKYFSSTPKDSRIQPWKELISEETARTVDDGPEVWRLHDKGREADPSPEPPEPQHVAG